MPETPSDFQELMPEESIEQRSGHELSEQRARAVELLRRDKEQGSLSAEAQDALMSWRIATEKSMAELNSQEPLGVIQVRVTMEQAKILRDAYWYQEAFDALYDTQTQARAENRRDLFEAAGDMIDEINKLE